MLAYPDHLTGLHLHGLNTNTPVLHSLASSQVKSFAVEWGFIPTPFDLFPSVLAVKTYCETVAHLGGVEESNGTITPVEGFVVRGQKRGSGVEPGEPFFWKVKYDEPYLMYRSWREVTRRLLKSYPDLDDFNPKKLREDDSRLYLWWVKREMLRDVRRFDDWKVGKGIIRTREEFLKWQKTDEAKDVRRQLGQSVAEDAEAMKNREFDRTLLVPIAVQGCGESSLACVLSYFQLVTD